MYSCAGYVRQKNASSTPTFFWSFFVHTIATALEWLFMWIMLVCRLSPQTIEVYSKVLAIPEAVYMDEDSDACGAHAYFWIHSEIMLPRVSAMIDVNWKGVESTIGECAYVVVRIHSGVHLWY